MTKRRSLRWFSASAVIRSYRSLRHTLRCREVSERSIFYAKKYKKQNRKNLPCGGLFSPLFRAGIPVASPYGKHQNHLFGTADNAFIVYSRSLVGRNFGRSRKFHFTDGKLRFFRDDRSLDIARNLTRSFGRAYL